MAMAIKRCLRFGGHTEKKMSIISFSIVSVFLVVILLNLCVIPLWDSVTAPYPPVKSSTLPVRKMPVFQGVAPQHTIFTSPWVIPLWDSATPHSPSGKELNPSFRKMPAFQGAAPWHTIFTSSCVIPLWDPAHLFLFGRIMFLKAYCFFNVLTLSCLGCL